MKLPALRVNYRRDRPQVASLDQWEQPADWTATLAEIAPVVVENVQRQLFFPLGRIIVVVQPFSLVIMMDGWMTRERGPDWGAGARKKDPQRVEWREIKSAVIYRLEQRVENAKGRGMLLEKFAVATPPETSPVDFGKAVHAEAQRRGMGRARVIYLVMDGAVWLWDLAEDRFKTAVKTLDLHPAREHLQSLAETLHGAGTHAAQAWLKEMLHGLRHGREARTVRRLDDLL